MKMQWAKIIRIDNKVDFKITGILKDIPFNTDRTQEIYVVDKNLKTLADWQANDDSWGGFNSETQYFSFIKTRCYCSTVEKAFPQIMKKYYANNPNQNVLNLKCSH